MREGSGNHEQRELMVENSRLPVNTPTKRPAMKPRIVLIEDDNVRIEAFRSWLAAGVFADEFVLIVATSGGQALGVLKMDNSAVAGICLDHDLASQQKTASDATKSGSDIVAIITSRIPKHVPILVHSMNVVKGSEMYRRLSGQGFRATRIPMSNLTARGFEAWLEEVHENWDPDEE